SYSVLSNTAIRANIPSGMVGTFDVTVTGPGGTSATNPADQFTYLTPPAPTVAGLSLTSGNPAGGPVMVVAGTRFTGATRVAFGATSVPFTVQSDTAIRIQVPAGVVGTVDVTVTTPGGTSAVNPADQFTYVAATPVVTSVSPATGLATGGTDIIII